MAKALNFYCDSSSHRNHEYVVVGGIALPPKRALEANDALQTIKDSAGIRSEFKWSKYSAGGREAAYKEAVDLFFGMLDRSELHFHCLICDFATFNHKKIGAGNPEKSVNKLYYQLMLHRVCAKYGKEHPVVMYPDHGADSSEIHGFRGAICAAAYKRYGAMPNCLRDINPVPSRDHNVMQMLDIVIGAFAAEREGRILARPKDDLRKHVMDASGIKDLSTNIGRANKMTVWNFEIM